MAAKGGLRIYIGATTDGFRKGMAEAESSADKFTKNVTHSFSRAQGAMDRLGKSSGRLSEVGGRGGALGAVTGLAAGFVSLGGAAAMIGGAVTATNDLYRASRQLGRVTGFDLQTSSAWVQMAKARGIETNSLTRGFTGLAKQLQAAQRGSKTATSAFEQLGVSQKLIRSGDTSAILEQIANSFSRHADGTGKAALASQLFGRNYQGMLQILNKGGGSLREMIRDEKLHGGVLDNNSAKYAKARESQLRFTMAMEKLKISLGSAVLPYLTKFTDKITKWLDKADNKKNMDLFVKGFAGIANQAMAIAQKVVPMVSAVGNFIGKHPGLVTLVADLVAFKLALKAISFVNPLNGLLGLIRRGRSAQGALVGLRAAAVKGGQGIVSALGAVTPKLTALLNRWSTAFVSRFGSMGASSGAAFGGSLIRNVVPFLLKFGKAFGAIGVTLDALVNPDSISPDFRNGRKAPQGTLLNNSSTSAYGKTLLSQIKNGTYSSATGSFQSALQALMSNTPIPGYVAEPSLPAQNTSTARRQAKTKKAGMSPAQAWARARKLKNWWVPYESRLRKISIHDHSLAAERQRQAIITEALGRWKSLRGEIKSLANDAHKGGNADIFGRIWDIVHAGDQQYNKWNASLPAIRDAIAMKSAENTVDSTSEQLRIAQQTAAAETAFLRTAFGFGDIGTGGLNAMVAAGGAPVGMLNQRGGNVNITINSLHPGDSKTKKAISSAVTSALGMQGARRTVRSSV